jgi:hypothetical protein
MSEIDMPSSGAVTAIIYFAFENPELTALFFCGLAVALVVALSIFE